MNLANRAATVRERGQGQWKANPRSPLTTILWRFLALLALLSLPAATGQETKTTYADHVRPVLQTRCFSCHSPDKKKGGLDLTAYAGLLAGGSGGAVVEGGNHAGSRLWTLTARKAEPFMPPEGDPLKPGELELLARWIDGGLLETSGSVARKSDKPRLDLVVTGTGRPEGPPPMPEHTLLEPVVVAERSSAISALAASPWAPLIALSGAKQVVLYHADTFDLAAILPYPEGFVSSLRFSRNGALLAVAGGRGGLEGNVVLFDVPTGRRLVEIGKELDTVLSADIRANHAMVAFGTPGKKLKVCDAGGAELYVRDKHSDWVTAVAFSPDGVLLASGDRNGGLRVWESDNGGEYLNLEAHKAAITALAWRPDSNVLASSSEDGEVLLWEMNGGAIVKRWTAHPGGVLSVDYSHDGNLVTSGRDRHVRSWKGDGSLIKDLADTPDLPTRVACLYDNARVVAGTWTGDLIAWNQNSGEVLGRATQNPPSIEQRIAAHQHRIADLTPQIQPAEQARQAAVQTLAAAETAAAEIQQRAAAAKARAAQVRTELAGLDKQLAAGQEQQTNSWKAMEAHRTVLQTFEQRRAQAAETERRFQEANGRADTVRKAIVEAQSDQAKLAPLTPQLAPLEQAEQQLAAELEAARAAIASPPAPLTEFAQRVQDADKAVAELELARKPRTADAAIQDAAVAEAEKQLAALAPQLEAQRKVLADKETAWRTITGEIASRTTAIAELKAAQFNVGVLAEKGLLTKLEAEYNGHKSALTTARAAQADHEKSLADSTNLIAQVDKDLPGLDQAVEKASRELGGLESTAAPLRRSLPELQAKRDQAKQIVAARTNDLAAAAQLVEEMKSFKTPAAPPADAVGVRELDQAREQLVAAEKGLADQAALVVTLRAGLAQQATNALAQATRSAAEAEKTFNDQAEQVANLEKAIAVKKAEIAKATTARDDAKQKRQAALEAIPKLGQAIAQAREAGDQAQAAAAAAEQAFAAQKAKVDQLHAQYVALRPK